jgi:lysophospholipase L1-like esterase
VPPPRPLGPLRRALILAAPTVTVLALLAAGECVLRLAWPRVDSLEVFVLSRSQRDDLSDRRDVRIFEGDPRLIWRLAPNLDRVVWDYTVVSTNAQGLRYARPLAARVRGGVRIACYGDSVTFGFRVPQVFPAAPDAYDHDAAPYPELLERRLRAANPGRMVEVVNVATPGYSSQQGLVQLRRLGEALAPDLVTLCFGWNDVSMRERPDRETMPMGPVATAARRVVGSSQLLLRAALLWRRVSPRGSRGSAAAFSVPRVSQDDYVANVLECARVARERGARVVVLAPLYGGSPRPDTIQERIGAYRSALRAATRAAGLPFFEAREFTEAGFPENRRLFPVEPIHPGELGHEVYAQALLRFLEEEGILASLGLTAPDEAGVAP